jgi:hypothetical protein
VNGDEGEKISLNEDNSPHGWIGTARGTDPASFPAPAIANRSGFIRFLTAYPWIRVKNRPTKEFANSINTAAIDMEET